MGLISYESAVLLGSLSTSLAIILSALLIFRHTSSWTNPKQQRFIVIIILMVPLFAVDSLVGLIDIEASAAFITILDGVKELYESVVIWSFLSLMFDYVKIDVATKHVPDTIKKVSLHIPFPYSMMVGHERHCDWPTVKLLEQWTLQFVYLRPTITVIETVWELLVDEPYADGVGLLFSWISTILLNISVTTAIYALMLFYHAFHEEMKSHRPLSKFLCIKGVVFFAFWQGVVLQILVHFGIIHAEHFYTVDEIDTAAQNLLVCLEMGLVFTFAHNYAFDPSIYQRKPKVN